MTVMKKF